MQLLVLASVATIVAGPLGSGASATARHVDLTGPTAGASSAIAPAPVSARVDVADRNHALPVPGSFLGISTEYWTIPIWAAHLPELRQVFSLIRQNGPVVLRIGGDSADRAIPSSGPEPPSWVFELTPAWLAQLRSIIRVLHVRLILDLNTVTASPTVVAGWARLADASLPPGSIVGFEIGNEPDIYNPLSFRASLGVTGAIPPRLTAKTYAEAFRSYDQALDRVVPRVPLLGPALADPDQNVNWIKTLLAGPHNGLVAITAHRYPYSACAHFGPKVPTVARVLSEAATAGIVATLRPALQVAARAHLPLRLTEFNSVTCGGTSGVSNTFATALWAPDALMELIHAGVDAAAVHVREHAINRAFGFSNGGLVAAPLLYGLATYARTLGTHPQLLPALVTVQPGVDLKTWVVLDGDQLRVLLIDKSRRAANVTLTLPTTGPATVQRLLAPSATATTGVTLAGQTLDAQGLWSGPLVQTTVAPRAGRYTVSVPGISAAIVTATVRPGTT